MCLNRLLGGAPVIHSSLRAIHFLALISLPQGETSATANHRSPSHQSIVLRHSSTFLHDFNYVQCRRYSDKHPQKKKDINSVDGVSN